MVPGHLANTGYLYALAAQESCRLLHASAFENKNAILEYAGFPNAHVIDVAQYVHSVKKVFRLGAPFKVASHVPIPDPVFMIYKWFIIWIGHECQPYQPMHKDGGSIYVYHFITVMIIRRKKFLITYPLNTAPVGDSESRIPRKVSPNPGIGVEIKKGNFEIMYLWHRSLFCCYYKSTQNGRHC